MQDQGKRLLIAVALALGVLFLWTSFEKKDEPPAGSAGSGSQVQAQPRVPQVGAPANAPAPSSGSSTAATPATASVPAAPGGPAPAEATPRPPEVPLTLTFNNVVATFSSYCGGLKSWRLTDARYADDGTHGWLLPEKSVMTATDATGKKAPVAAAQLANLPDCGAFDVNFASAGSTYFVPRNAVWKGEQLSPTEVRYSYASDQLDVVKTFTIWPDKYMVKMAVAVTVHAPTGTEAHEQLAVSSYAYQDPAALKEASRQVAARAWSSATMRNGEIVESDVNGVLEWPRFEPTLQWTGFEHPYLLVGYAPQLRDGEHVEKHSRASKGDDGRPLGFMTTDMLFPSTVVHAGDPPITRAVVGYLGPKNYDDLENADAIAGFATGFHTVVDLGWFGFIGRPLLWLLQQLHGFVGNWGVAIILLTILLKLALLYWTTRSMRSMKAMAALAPQMKVLQAKYGDDKQRQQAETMALYKQHNVNPVAGCLPILLQTPIWLALYRMLSNAGELYRQPFIPGWISDLTATDPYYVLPGLLVVTMFVQARLQPAAVDSTQQKFMQYGMPIMFGAFSFICPAGLTIYMFTNALLSAVHSTYMNRFDKKSLAIVAKMKLNQEDADKAAAAAKTGAKNGAAAKPKAAKPVIDVKATEASTTETDDEAAEAPASPATGPAANRPRRKKRRR